jgi:hypothetical protein
MKDCYPSPQLTNNPQHKSMKSKHNPFLPLFAIVVTVGLSPLRAAAVDTTGTTITLNTDAPGNKYLGDGTLQVSTDGVNASIDLGTGAASLTITQPAHAANIALPL